MEAIRQFGRFDPALAYVPRAAGYELLERDGRIACVRIGHDSFKYDFPGGAVDPGETAEQAVGREFGEETGLAVEVVREIAGLNHYIIHEDGTPYNNHARFFEVRLIGEKPEAKVEADHELVWLDPLQVITRLKNEGYAWALVLWLRQGAALSV